jgi:co-chaperonin GroES (HSP10)
MTVKFKESSLAERLILKPLIEKVSKGGIVIARDERTQAINTNRGIVLMIGPQCWFDLPEKPDIKVGDSVYYAKYGAMVLRDEENPEDFYVLCNDKDILVSYEGVAAKEAGHE